AERLPELGVIRVYPDEGRWQEAVAEMSRSARLIVLHLGESPGLTWEIEHVVRYCEPERLILSLVTEGGCANSWDDGR
ncbi:MAG: hypothetical protein ABR540_19435, partial [Acidimicrobiales bacterium]